MVTDTERVWIDYQDAAQGDLVCEHRHGQLLVERVIASGPELPGALYTVIRVTLTTGGTLVMLLDEKGWLSDKGGRTPIDNITSFEVLAEPREVTMEHVLAEAGGLISTDGHKYLRRELGLPQYPRNER